MNKMTLIGNLTRDPETRVIHRNGGESTVTNFTVAVNDGYGDHRHTEYVRISAWAMYLKKGMKVYAAGPASVNAYVNSEGKAVGQMELRLDEIEFLSKVFGTEQNESPAEPDDIEALL